MTESDIAAIRDALAADGLTHGEWVACGPSFGDPRPRYLNEVIRPDDADGGDTVACAMEGIEADGSADMAYIAACHPDRIARLLDALDSAQKDAERWRGLYRRAVNEANGLTNYVEDRPELRRAERNLTAIESEARAAIKEAT